MSYGFLAIVEESIRGPDFTGHQVVERQDVHWSVELESLILPTLSEKDIHSVLLKEIKGSNGNGSELCYNCTYAISVEYINRPKFLHRCGYEQL